MKHGQCARCVELAAEVAALRHAQGARSTSYPAETAMTAQGALEIAANIAEDRGWMGKPYPGVEIAKAIRDVAKKGYWTRDSSLTSTDGGAK